MLNHIDFYYFSPTGGTKKTGEILANAMARNVNSIDMAKKIQADHTSSSVALIAVPVFGGRIPSLAADYLAKYNGAEKKAVTVVVYGNRAYEDALLELNDILKKSKAQIVASGAFVAQHSMVPEVGAGRPDMQDIGELKTFAQKILTKLEDIIKDDVQVPGSYPYKPRLSMPVTPISLPSCNLCEKCTAVCPSNAIKIENDTVLTDVNKCILCMACVHDCPKEARVLPLSLQKKMEQNLGMLKGIRKENELFL